MEELSLSGDVNIRNRSSAALSGTISSTNLQNNDVIAISANVSLSALSSTYNGRVIHIINTSTSNRTVSGNTATGGSYTLYDRESRSFVSYNSK